MVAITAILFDKDGTLFDFHRSWGSWAAGILDDLEARQAADKAALATALGFDVESGCFLPSSPAIAGTPGDVVRVMMPHLPQMRPNELANWLIDAAEHAPMVPAVPLDPLMERLAARGLTLGVVTNDAEGPARAHLDGAGILARFDFVAGCDSGHGAKPDPGPLLAFARETGRGAGEVMMVGDSRHDLNAGRAAGMMTVGVLTGLARAEGLADLADAVLPDIGHLPALLDRLAGPAPGPSA
ncbi:HAD family hydrolase [Rhodovulum sp. P5]|uniref:HAD family hydrolase n=1 Tax=Rhodovulum sp. P5 TaxID=1564506 RepID=UPI0009DB1CFE|nr:HAD family hydrolase [Rhodovulum sp. P5]